MANRIVTPRLRMVQLDVDEAIALVDGRGGSGRTWAPGYPDDGALVSAGFVMTAAKHGRDLGPFGTYEIIRREDGAVIGAAGFYGKPDDTGAVRVGYGLAESARGHGYATEALIALLEWAQPPGRPDLRARRHHAHERRLAAGDGARRDAPDRRGRRAPLLHGLSGLTTGAPATL